eukprot:gene9691-1897_t
MNSVVTVVIGGTNLFSGFVGVLIDLVPLRISSLIGTSLWVTGITIFAFCTFFRELDLYFWWLNHFSMFTNSIGTMILFFTYMRFAPQIQSPMTSKDFKNISLYF